jgi:hypothetical protein
MRRAQLVVDLRNRPRPGEPFTLVVPVHTASEANARGHWGKKYRRTSSVREAVALCWGAYEARLPVVVTITRIAPHVLDGDNLVGGATKAARDQVAVELGLPIKKRGETRWAHVADDRDERVEWRVEQRRGDDREYAIEIRVEPRRSPMHDDEKQDEHEEPTAQAPDQGDEQDDAWRDLGGEG